VTNESRDEHNKNSNKIKKETMELIILPGSGGGFVNQTALLTILFDNGYIPDVLMGSSGGNINAYMSYASGWDSGKIKDSLKILNNKIFIKKYVNNDFLSFLKGSFGGNSIYDHPEKSFTDEVFSLFRGDQTDVEVWTGCFNKMRCLGKNYCNKYEHESIFKNDPVANIRCQYMEPEYLDRSSTKMHLVSRASATVPFILPPIDIDNEPMVDGGCSYPSPILYFIPQLRRISANRTIHVIYIDCHNPFKRKKVYDNIISNAKFYFKNIYNNMSLHEVNSLVDFVGTEDITMIDSEEITILEAMELRKKYKKSFLHLYPRYKMNVDLMNFDGDCCIKNFDFCRENYMFQLFLPIKKKSEERV
jgi:hypothetical protein